MTAHIENIETRMTTAQASLRPYLGELLGRLAQTYGIPLGLGFLVATGGGVLVTQLLPQVPQSTVSVVLFAINVLIFWYGWRWLEGRTHATSLYILYVRTSQQRRALARLIQTAKKGQDIAKNDVALHIKAYEDAVEGFKQALTTPLS